MKGGLVLGLVGCALVACGGQSFTVASGDGGTELDAGADTGAACVTLPANTGGEQQFCEDEQHIFVKCGNCEQCRQSNLNDCRTLGDVLSDTFKSAVHACRDSAICGDYTSYASSPCVRQQFAGAQPTSRQEDMRTAYCGACPNNGAECDRFFDLGADAGAGNSAGIGAYVLVSSDVVVDTMVQGCVGPQYCAPLAFLACTGGKLCAAAPADHCRTGFCFK